MTDSAYSKPRKNFTTPIEQTALNIARKRLNHPLKIFVAGPYIKKDWTANEKLLQSNAALLRKHIVDHIEDTSIHNVVLGEHRGVLEISDNLYRTMSSSMTTEFDLVHDADAIIIIPASAGSFCELGSWSSQDSLCRKMLILADNQHEKAINYLTTGVFKTTVGYGSKLVWVDYAMTNDITGIVNDFIYSREDYALSRRAVNGR